MTCQTCGRPAESGQATHWLGCAEAAAAQGVPPAGMIRDHLCEHDECSEPKKEYSGRGARPKYCEEHSDPKNRK